MNHPLRRIYAHPNPAVSRASFLGDLELSLDGGCPACGLEKHQFCACCGRCNCDTHDACTRPEARDA